MKDWMQVEKGRLICREETIGKNPGVISVNVLLLDLVFVAFRDEVSVRFDRNVFGAFRTLVRGLSDSAFHDS